MKGFDLLSDNCDKRLRILKKNRDYPANDADHDVPSDKILPPNRTSFSERPPVKRQKNIYII